MLTDVMRTTFETLGARLQSFAPNLLAMLLLLLLGLLAAWATRTVLHLLLPRLGIDSFAERSGLRAVASHGGLGRPVSDLLALVGSWLVLVTFVLLAVAALDVRVAMELVTRGFAWLPHLMLGLLLLVAGSLRGRLRPAQRADRGRQRGAGVGTAGGRRRARWRAGALRRVGAGAARPRVRA